MSQGDSFSDAITAFAAAGASLADIAAGELVTYTPAGASTNDTLSKAAADRISILNALINLRMDIIISSA